MRAKPTLCQLGTILVGGLVLTGWTRTAVAATVTLIDDNSQVDIETELQAGVTAWTVDGVSHLKQQWYWFRVGGAGPELSIDSLILDFAGTSDANFDGDDDALFVRYKDPADRFIIEVRFTLNGGSPGFGSSNFDELITVTNTGTTSLEFHFFEYANFDLTGNANNDSVEMIGSNTVLQTDGSGAALTETVTAPAGNHHELKIVPLTIDALNDGLATTLDDSGGPVGPADVSWAFQWSVQINVGGSFQVSKIKAIEVAVGCGNNTIDAGEECDGTDTGTCAGACVPAGEANECTCAPACGDNTIDIGEECDGTDTGTCAGTCVPAGDVNECTCTPVCGDNTIDAGEECDGTDTGTCTGVCVPAGEVNECTCAPVCGDNTIDSGEECDGTDAGTCAGACVPAGEVNECTCAPACGDNTIDTGEECDGTDTGTCAGACVPAGEVNECTCAPACGDDTIDAGEECDGTDTGTCVSDCIPAGDRNECTCAPACGDNTIDTGEECDGTDTGTCVSDCVPAGELNECTCAPACGDNTIDSGEECDGSDTGSCAGECVPAGDVNECTCAPACGDNMIDAGEECDGTDTGSCVMDCLPPGDPNECTCVPFCGDGDLDPGEECDDGNNVDGDDCSADCLSELGACCNFNGGCQEDLLEGDCLSDPNHVWNRAQQCADVDCEEIPTVSEWALVIMTLLGCTLGSVIYRNRRAEPA